MRRSERVARDKNEELAGGVIALGVADLNGGDCVVQRDLRTDPKHRVESLSFQPDLLHDLDLNLAVDEFVWRQFLLRPLAVGIFRIETWYVPQLAGLWNDHGIWSDCDDMDRNQIASG